MGIAGKLRSSAFNKEVNKTNGPASLRVRQDAWDSVPGQGVIQERKRNAVLMSWILGR